MYVVEKDAKVSVTLTNFTYEHDIVNNTGKEVLVKANYS